MEVSKLIICNWTINEAHKSERLMYFDGSVKIADTESRENKILRNVKSIKVNHSNKVNHT